MPLKRRIQGGAIASAVFVFALSMLIIGKFEGGAFVSMVTLGLICASLFVLRDRISHITLWGNEIRLNKLTRQAEDALDSLNGSRVELLRTLLELLILQPKEVNMGARYAIPASDRRLGILVDIGKQALECNAMPKLADDYLAMSTVIAVDVLQGLFNKGILNKPRESSELFTHKQEIAEEVHAWIEAQRHESDRLGEAFFEAKKFAELLPLMDIAGRAANGTIPDT